MVRQLEDKLEFSKKNILEGQHVTPKDTLFSPNLKLPQDNTLQIQTFKMAPAFDEKNLRDLSMKKMPHLTYVKELHLTVR